MSPVRNPIANPTDTPTTIPIVELLATRLFVRRNQVAVDVDHAAVHEQPAQKIKKDNIINNIVDSE